MSRDALFAEAMRLPVDERRALALRLLATVEEDRETDELEPAEAAAIEDAWHAEIVRRRRLLDAGELERIPWEEVRAELFRDDE